MSEVKYQVNNIKISECFEYLSGNTGLTVRAIHNSKSEKFDCVVLSSSLLDDTSLGYIDSKTILPNGKGLKLFKEKEGIVISRNGYAGTMSYLVPGLYTLTDHAYILYKKEKCNYEIDLNWFILFYQKFIREKYLTTKSGNQTFAITKFMEDFVFDIPEIKFQKDIAEKYKLINRQKQSLITQKKKIIDFNLEKITGYEIKEEELFNIFKPHQGNAVFTKKNINNKGWKGNIPVISSNTDNDGILDYVDRKYVQDKDYIDVPCLTWSVDGYAGKLFERNTDSQRIGFVANNHCGILYPKIDVSKLYFPYLIYTLQHQFFIRAKNSGNKKLGNNQMKDIIVAIPIDKNGDFDYNAQVEIAEKYRAVDNVKRIISKKIDELVGVEILFH